jgi:hypothetical protein
MCHFDGMLLFFCIPRKQHYGCKEKHWDLYPEKRFRRSIEEIPVRHNKDYKCPVMVEGTSMFVRLPRQEHRNYK